MQTKYPWPTVELGEVCDELTVGFVGSMASEYVDAGVPFIRSLNVKPFRIDKTDIKYVSPEFHAKIRKSRLRAGDVVIVRTGVPGTTAVVPDWLDGGNCSDLVIARPSSRLDPGFLCYFMNAVAHHVGRMYAVGAVQQHFNVGAAKTLRIPLPPLPTQRAIAGVLGTLDDKIEVNRRMARTLEAAARALFESWFVRFEHPGGKATAPRLVDSPMGPIPEGWTVRPIGELVEAVGGGTPSTKDAAFWTDGLYPFCTPKDMSGIAEAVILSTERKVTEAGLAQISSGLLPSGTVIMSSRAPIGYLGIAEVPLTVNQGIIAMKCTKGVPPVWVLRWCETNMDRIKAAANGSTFMEISKHHFRPIGAIVPPSGVVTEYSRIAEPMYRRVVSAVQQNHTLAAIRDVLLPRLISGELEVPEAIARAEGGA